MSFDEAALDWGLEFEGTTGGPPFDDLSKVNGGGIAAGDVNGDGLPDLYVARTGANLLYLNQGNHFEEAAEAWGVADPGRGAGAVLVDLTGDALPDLLLSNFGRDRYYRNLGDRFEPMPGFDDDGMGMGMAVADFDGDGWGDVYLARYVEWPDAIPTEGGPCQWRGVPVLCGPEAYRPQGDLFYRGGPGGSLTLAESLPVARPGRGMGAMVLDANQDGRPDIYVANDASDNFLFLNHSDGWVEDALARGAALSANGAAEAGMGVAGGDLDHNGWEDVVVTNFDGQTHSVYLALPDWFEERSARVRVAAPSLKRLSWAVQAEDFDLDGDLDLHVVNGHLYANAAEFGARWDQPDDLFVNDGMGRFKVQHPAWEAIPASGRSSAVADFDGDGRLDIAVWNLGQRAHLMINRGPVGNRLTATVEPRAEQPEAAVCGAKLTVHAAGQVQTRWFRRGSGYLGSNDHEVVFGLGNGEADSLVVEWPHGGRDVFPVESSTLTVSPR